MCHIRIEPCFKYFTRLIPMLFCVLFLGIYSYAQKEIKPIPENVKLFIRDLKNHKKGTRAIAAYKLGKLYARAVHAVPVLISILGDTATIRRKHGYPFQRKTTPADESKRALIRIASSTKKNEKVVARQIYEFLRGRNDQETRKFRLAELVIEEFQYDPYKEPLSIFTNSENSEEQQGNSARSIRVSSTLSDNEDQRPIFQEEETTVVALVKCLTNKSVKTRLDAVKKLGKIKDPETVPHLLHMCSDERLKVRKQARLAIISFGENAAKPLFKALENPGLSSSAESILSALGTKISDPVIKAIESNEYSDIRDRLLAIFMKSDPRHSALLLLKSKNTLAQISAIQVLGQSRYVPAIDHLANALNDKKSQVRSAAIQTLEDSFGWVPKNNVEETLACVAKQDWKRATKMGVRAKTVLSWFKEDSDPVVRKAVIKVMNAPTIPGNVLNTRITSNKVLKKFSGNKKPLKKNLLMSEIQKKTEQDLNEQQNHNEKLSGLMMLLSMNKKIPKNSEYSRALDRLLNSKGKIDVLSGLYVLKEQSKTYPEVGYFYLSKLISMLNREDVIAKLPFKSSMESYMDLPTSFSEVTRELLEIMGENALPQLIDGLGHQDLVVSSKCMDLIIKSGQSAVKLLMETVERKSFNPQRAIAAVAILGKLKDKEAGNLLITELGNWKDGDNWQFRVAIEESLAEIGKPILGELLNFISNDNKGYIKSVIIEICKKDGIDQDNKIKLISMLEKGDAVLQSNMITLIRDMKDSAFIPNLIHVMKNTSDSDIRFEIQWALENITGQRLGKNPKNWEIWLKQKN